MKKLDPAHAATDKELADLEQRIAVEYRKAAEELQEKIDAYFERFKKRDAEQKALIGTIVNGREYTEQDYKQWRLAQIGRGKRFEALRDRVAERMTNANTVAAAYINGEMPKIYAMNRRYSIDEAVKQSGGMLDGSDFILWDENVVKRLLVEQPDLMPYYPRERAVKRGIDLAYGKRKITEYVTSGILQGSGIKEIARNLMDNVENMERVSAVRAARTAVTNAANAGRQDADAELSEKGAIIEKEWVSMMLPTTRHPHAHANGQRVSWDEPFIVGGERLMFPADGSMGASGWNLYNCQCVRVRKVVGYKSILSPEKKAAAKIRIVDTEEVAQSSKSGAIRSNRPKKIPEVKKSGTFKKTSTPKDVTKEYLSSATPGQGSITYEDGYKTKGHRAEIAMAEWIHRTFGGEIVLLKESEVKGQMRPDFLWNRKFWELKGASTINGADKLLQHAIKQIQDNPGGVILDVVEDIDMPALERQLASRVHRSKIDVLDLMILSKTDLIKVLRYKK